MTYVIYLTIWLLMSFPYTIGTLKQLLLGEKMLSQQPTTTTSLSTSIIEKKLESRTVLVDEHKAITLKILNENFDKGQFSGCLVLDYDETLLQYELSAAVKQVVLKRKHEMAAIIKEAKQNNILVVIGTARTASKEQLCKDAPYLSVDSGIKAIGIEHFSAVYFSNGNFKSPILLHLKDKFFKDDPEGFDKIAFVDDLDCYLNECRQAGFKNSFCSDNPLLQFDLRDFFAAANGRQPEPLIVEDEKLINYTGEGGEIVSDDDDEESEEIDQFEPDPDSDYCTFFKKYNGSKSAESKSLPADMRVQKLLLSEKMGEALEGLDQDDAELLGENGILNNITVQLMLDGFDIQEFLLYMNTDSLDEIRKTLFLKLSEDFYKQLYTIMMHLHVLGVKDETQFKRMLNVASNKDNLNLLSYLVTNYPKNLLDLKQLDAMLEIFEILTKFGLSNQENITKLKQMKDLNFVSVCAVLQDLEKSFTLDKVTLNGILEPEAARSTLGLKQSS